MTSPISRIRIGTRGSRLALWQAHHIADQLQSHQIPSEIIVIQTLGDRDKKTPFGAMGTKNIFIKEIEGALLDNTIDLAVHSLKDLPALQPQGLTLAAVPVRASAMDALFSPKGLSLKDLPPGSSIATGSLRRTAQALALRPDIRVVPIRGNVPTRLEKIRQGEADATLLAVAGLERLGLQAAITQVLSPECFTPAMGQGALGIETREGWQPECMNLLNDPISRQAVDAERHFMARIGGGCHTPAGVFASPEPEGGWRLFVMLATPDGSPMLRRNLPVAPHEDLVAAAEALAETLLAEAPPAILATLEPPKPTKRAGE